MELNKIRTMEKCRYNVIINGKEEAFTGLFETIELANKWYNNHGQFFIKRGHKLKLVFSNSDIQ